jgi:hypothetical protein
MTEKQRNRLAARWGDEALRQYSAAEPRPGLETRIIATLAAEKRTARTPWLDRWFLRPGFLVAGAAVLLLLAAGPQYRHLQRSRSPSPVAGILAGRSNSLSSAIAHPAPGQQRQSASLKHPVLVTRRTSLPPRPAKFPTPGPLSPQERLLLRYLQHTPPEELVAVIGEDRRFEEQALEMEIQFERTIAQ